MCHDVHNTHQLDVHDSVEQQLAVEHRCGIIKESAAETS